VGGTRKDRITAIADRILGVCQYKSVQICASYVTIYRTHDIYMLQIDLLRESRFSVALENTENRLSRDIYSMSV